MPLTFINRIVTQSDDYDGGEPIESQTKKMSDIKYLLPMLLFAKLFSIAPAYDRADNEFRAKVYQKVFAAISVAGVAAAYVLTLPRRLFLFTILDSMQNSMDVFNTLSSIAINAMVIISANFWNSRHYTGLLNSFLAIDDQMQSHRHQSKNSSRYRAEIIAAQALLVVNLVSGVLVYFVGSHSIMFRHYVIECLLRYHMYLMVIVEYNLILSVKHRFETLNEIVATSCQRFTHRRQSSRRFMKPNYEFVRVERMIGVHSSLCDLVESFNAVFGWVSFVLTLHIICNVLLCLYNVVAKNILTINSGTANCLILSCVLMELLMGIMIAAASDMAHREAQETGNICYILLHELNRVPKTSQVLLLQDSLQRLGKQASICCPYFSAGAFLRIDYTWLFVIMQLTTSYFVVILQFKS